MFQSNLPKHFWSYAIKHAVFLINRVPSPIIQNKTPFELLHNEPPDFSMIKSFGCLYYASINAPRKKIDVHSRRGIFLGFQTGTKGYVIFYINNKEIFISRNVQFNEKIFPFSSSQSISEPIENHTNPLHIKTNSTPDTPFPLLIPPVFLKPTSPTSSSSISPSPSPDQHTSPSPDSIASAPPPPSPTPRHSNRLTNRPRYLNDYYCNTSSSDSAFTLAHPNQSSSLIRYPIQSFIDYSHLSSSHSHFLMCLHTEQEPKTYQEVVTQPCWQEAIQVEIAALIDNQTWDIVTTPPSIKPIGCKWVQNKEKT